MEDDPKPQPETNKPAEPEVKSRSISNKVLLSLVVVASVLVLTVAAFAYKNYSASKEVISETTPSPSPAPSLEVKTPVSERIIDEGVTWLPLQKLSDQGLFEKSGADSAYSSTDYYKVGTTSSGGEIIIALVNIDSPGQTNNIQRIIKNGETYKRISQNSEKIDGNEFAKTSKLEDDNTFVFKSLLADKVISKDDTELISNQSPRLITEDNPKAETKKVASSKWGDIYLEKTNSYSIKDVNQAIDDKNPVIRISRYYILLNDSTQLSYEPRPKFLRDDNTFDLTFKSSEDAKKKYEKFETGGCGLGFGNFPFMVDRESLTEKDVFGEAGASRVYTITNPDNKTIKYSYELYKSDGASGKKSAQDFATDKAFVYWIDAYGSTIGFLNSDYKPAIECGKPVVYLYPKKETSFKVSVGALVTKSDPEYLNGWQGVAKPNGTLTVKGNNYSNLFWEGKGLGSYPNIDFGRLVERSSVEAEIVKDLKKVGLNDQEISDFNAYWLDKMPKNKYIRLSYLTNDELDKLAPLYIQPKPDTVIRVFLDFAGYDHKINLSPQTLPKYQRNGFTAVEWGGLLKVR